MFVIHTSQLLATSNLLTNNNHLIEIKIFIFFNRLMNSPNYDPNVLIPDGENSPASSPELPQDPSAMISVSKINNIC